MERLTCLYELLKHVLQGDNANELGSPLLPLHRRRRSRRRELVVRVVRSVAIWRGALRGEAPLDKGEVGRAARKVFEELIDRGVVPHAHDVTPAVGEEGLHRESL